MENLLSYELLNEEILAETFGRDTSGVITVPTASHNNCGNRCVIKIQIKGGRILGLTTDSCEDTPEHPQIRSCLRGRSYLDTFLSKDRLLYPMKRTGKRGEGKFTRISWEEAVSTIAAECCRIRDAYGPQSRYCNYATGYEMCAAVPSAMIRRLLALDGGYLGYYNNYSCSPSALAAELTYGTTYTGSSRNDYCNSKLLILWGFNPAETNCGGNTMFELRKAKDAGARIIVIDSRFSDTAAALADEWIAPLPTTDSALSDAMAYVIYKNGLHNQIFLDTYCMGFDEHTLPEGVSGTECYRSYLLGESDGIPKTPAWAGEITGITPQVIEDLALAYASTKPSAILEGYGPGRHAWGEQFSRGLITLACMTGNVGISGGSAAGLGQVPYGVDSLSYAPGLIDNPYPGKIPCFCWTDVIEDAASFTPSRGLQGVDRLDSGIKMIFNLAGNCLINQHADCNHTWALLADTTKVEFIVCSDIFMTPSARYADILLPGTTMLETENITASPARFDYFFKINPVIAPPGECRFDYDWISHLAEKLGHYDSFTCRKNLSGWLDTAIESLREQLPDFPDMYTFTRSGVYKRNPTAHHIAFRAQIEDFSNHPFETPSGKIELFVPSLYERRDPDAPAIPGYHQAWEGPADPLREKYPLQCIGFHTKARTHSVHDNNPTLRALVPQQVWMNPADSAPRGIKDFDQILVYNSRGALQIPVKITKRIRPGVIAIPQGAWFSPDAEGVDRGGCINTITSLRPTPIAKANAQHTNLVEVKLAVNLAQVEALPEKSSGGSSLSHSLCTGCMTCILACPYGRMKVLEIENPCQNHTLANDKHVQSSLPVKYKPISCGSCSERACAAACPLRLLTQ